jgi:transposase-like protein
MNVYPEGVVMVDFPRSLCEFQKHFPNDAACADYLAAKRWPDGFRCPHCGERKSWHLPSRRLLTFRCAKCQKETSVTAGTSMHRSHLPLTVWFWAAYLMATHSNGMSALQLKNELGLGSYKTAWLLAMKLRRAMVAPNRSPLSGLVEADETTIPFRTKDDPPAGGQGRSHDGKLLIAGAVEIKSGKKKKLFLGRVRLSVITDYCAKTLVRQD